MFRTFVIDSVVVIRPTVESFLEEQSTELRGLIETLRRRHCTRLAIDLSGCRRISSEGLGTIASCWRRFQEKGMARLAVVLPDSSDNREVVNLFDITGLSTAIGSALRRNLASAVNYLCLFGRG
jgi:anti-anti-sigma regulatory factor